MTVAMANTEHNSLKFECGVCIAISPKITDAHTADNVVLLDCT